jgi:hypothetical protein
VTVVGVHFITKASGTAIVTKVTFGGTAGTALNVTTATSLKVTTPKHTAATAVLLALTPTVTGSSNPTGLSFTYKIVTTKPTAPPKVTLVASTGAVTVTFVVPATGGAPISSFSLVVTTTGVAGTPIVVTVGTKGSATGGTAGGTDTYLVSGLTPGSKVSVSVAATNVNGTGAATTSSMVTVPNKITGPTVPGAPKDVKATAGDSQATLSWTVPATGGSIITSFTIIPYKKGVAEAPITEPAKIHTAVSSNVGVTDHITLKKLTNSDTYKFSVAATNVVGTGPATTSNTVTPHSGFWMCTSTGVVYAFGNAKKYGTEGGKHLNKPIVGMTSTTSNKGYWMVASDGGIFAFGNAKFFGSMGSKHLNKPVVGMAASPTGKGYWLVASDGGIFSFGKAKFYGSTGSIDLHSPIVGMTVVPTGHGYWMVAADGGIFAFGKAKFKGSEGSSPIKKPMVGITATKDGKGYWMVTGAGVVYAFGDAKNYGQPYNTTKHLNVYGIVRSVNGTGYWVVAAPGHIYNYGDAEHFAPVTPPAPIVAMTPMH